MKKVLLIFLCVSLYCNYAFSQTNLLIENDSLPAKTNNKQFVIKTDVLSLLNSVIANETDFDVSGELCFQDYYSFQGTIALQKEKYPGYNNQNISCILQFRYYICNEDYTGLFVAPYVGMEKARIVIDKHDSQSDSHIYFKRIKSEAGLSGGYLMPVNNHLLIEAEAYAGYSLVTGYHIIEMVNTFRNRDSDGLQVRVMLNIGWRF